MPTASSVSQFGVTFNFSAARTVGQYCNGDWWVLGPVTITGISPASIVMSGTFQGGAAYTGRVAHGAQLNPGNRADAIGGLASNNAGSSGLNQGFDGMTSAAFDDASLGASPAAYSAGLNVDPGATGVPLVVTEGTVVKAISDPSPPTNGRPCITDLVALTVVTSIPLDGSFRPAQALASKAALWNEADLDYSFLPSLPAPSSAPTFAAAAAAVSRLRYLGKTLNVGALNVMPSNNHANYGREQSHEKSAALLRLCTAGTVAEKRDCMIYMVQMGIDVLGRVAEGGIFPDNGGNSSGWKTAGLLAARALGSGSLKALAVAPATFAEDRQHFYVSQADVDRARYTADGRPRDPYTTAMIGTPEWGEAHIATPSRDGSNLDAAYRQIAAGAGRYHGLFARLIPNMEADWNSPVSFAYWARYFSFGPDFGTSGGNAPAFQHDMLLAYNGVVSLSGATAQATVTASAAMIPDPTPPTLPIGRLQFQQPAPEATGRTRPPGIMPIPADAKRFSYEMDPADVVDFVFDARPSMDDDETISGTWSITMSAAGASVGLQIRSDGVYVPTLVIGGGGIRFWLRVDSAVQSAQVFDSNGIDIPLTVKWVTNNVIPRTLERTLVVTIRQR